VERTIHELSHLNKIDTIYVNIRTKKLSVRVSNEHLDVGLSVSDEDLQALKETSENFWKKSSGEIKFQMKDIVHRERRYTF
jgi:hypothetical protein